MTLNRLNVHKNRHVQEAVEAKGCTLLFSSYGSDLSPTEFVSKLESRVRRAEAQAPS